ncbi:MAG: ABC transporter ATP-binding protein [Cystobacterineae bacterium]|nr:ABC transporter ATP-binding protein [Cystobacterineae bacterium]
MKQEPLIRFEDLHLAFGDNPVYEGLSLTVYRGQTLAVIGGSGCGKSVLLKCLIGLLYPNRGRVFYEDIEVSQLPEQKLRSIRKDIAMVFQSAALFDSLSVGENLAYPLREHMPHLSEKEMSARVAQTLELVNLPGIERMQPAELSGGMRKRVGLARAIMTSPKVILWDEPTTGLDPISTRIIDELIISMKKHLGCTSIVVTHDMNSVFRVADSIAMLAHRKIVASGSVEQMRRSTNPDVCAFFGAGENR